MYMGGKYTSRGIFYQALSAVLEALEHDGWTEISVEYDTNDDKIDIALFDKNMLTKAIQVKSSINAFGQTEVKKWIKEIYKDSKSSGLNIDECIIYLIGSVTKGITDLKNALENYYNGNTNKTNQKILEELDIESYNGTKLSLEILPLNTEHLMSISRDKLNKYLNKENIEISQEQLVIVTNVIATEKMKLSSTGEKISRGDFNKAMRTWLSELKDYKKKELRKVSIRSFSRGTDNIHTNAEFSICLVDMFKGRYLKEGLCWNENIYSQLVSETTKAINDQDLKYQLHINAHTSIAFAMGRLLDSKSGIHAFPIQRTANYGEQLWEIKKSSKAYDLWDINWLEGCPVNKYNFDCVLIVNVTHDITNQVEEYLLDENIEVNRKIICKLSGQCNSAITNGEHAQQLSDEISKVLTQRTREERLGRLHVFISAPIGFVYYLGSVSRGFGKIVLYEYDYEQNITGTYSPSIMFPNEYEE